MSRSAATGPGIRAVAIRAALSRAESRPVIAALATFLPVLALYARTLLPDVGFWDTAEFQAVGPVLGIAHPTGFPTYTLLAWLASVVLQPFGNEALRANLLSALLVAGGAGIVAATVTLLTRRLVLGVAAGVALAVGARAWAIALRADPHALHLFLVALLLLLLVVWAERENSGQSGDRWLLAATAVFGLSLGNHALTVLLAPGIALYLLAVAPGLLRRPRFVAGCVATLVVTTISLYAYLPIRSAMNPPLDYADPQTWEGFSYLVFAEQFQGELRGLPGPAAALAAVATETFGQLGVVAVLALMGTAAMVYRRPSLFVLLGTWFALGWLFALSYSNADIARYYLVPTLSAAVLGGFGAGALWDAAEQLWSGAASHPGPAAGGQPGGTHAGGGPAAGGQPGRQPGGTQAGGGPAGGGPAGGGPAAAVAAGLAVLLFVGPTVAGVPGRFPAIDQSTDRNARYWLDAVMASLPPDAVVVSWWSYSTTLWYGLHVEHRRPDVMVIDDSTIVTQDLGDASTVIDSYLGRRPVFLIRLPFDLPAYNSRYVLTALENIPGGPIFRVEGMRARGDPDSHL